MVCCAIVASVLLGVPRAAATAPEPTPAPAGEVLVTDIGAGFAIEGSDQAGAEGQVTRTFRNGDSWVSILALPITTPPGVRTMFDLFNGNFVAEDLPPPPELELAAWLELPGGGESLNLAFGSKDHLFIIFHEGPEPADATGFLVDIANRQIDAAGGPPSTPEVRSSDQTEAEAELVAMLPSDPPPGYGLGPGTTLTGKDELEATDGASPEVVEFLNERATSAARVWSSFGDEGDLVTIVDITQYPYDIFAAASVPAVADTGGREVVSTDALTDVPDVTVYTGGNDLPNQVGATFRRGDLAVLVSTIYTGAVTQETAAALTADVVRLTSQNLPPGDTEPYEFPETPSKLLGLGLTAAIVTAAAGGSAAIARLRARRVRRSWSGGALPPPQENAPQDLAVAPGEVVDLDADASRLRRQGGIVAVGQLLSVVIGVVALAGDFAWRGVIVAALALIAGLALTHWWQRHELGLLGAKAPPRELVLPRPAGAIVGVLSLAVLGFGVGYLLKGLRYLVLKPTLAQLQWSDRFGISPVMVGVVFTIGGFVVAVIGGYLFRLARALGKAGTKRTLAADGRPAALYLRSFEDDNLPLPVIASARRPLFELFSVRGADPFEESVAWELNSYGPVVAVGRPGKSLASLGAAREHLPDETWRDQVATRMDEAGIIAVATGESDGLSWELGQVVSGGHMSKTFFVFPPVAPDAIGRRWEHTAAALTEAGQPVGPLPVPASMIHTVTIDADGTTNVTVARRRDEATYRTAVDRSVTLGGVDPHAEFRSRRSEAAAGPDDGGAMVR